MNTGKVKGYWAWLFGSLRGLKRINTRSLLAPPAEAAYSLIPFYFIFETAPDANTTGVSEPFEPLYPWLLLPLMFTFFGLTHGYYRWVKRQ